MLCYKTIFKGFKIFYKHISTPVIPRIGSLLLLIYNNIAGQFVLGVLIHTLLHNVDLRKMLCPGKKCVILEN